MATINEITEAQTCECNAKDMPFAACCKARKAFEAWYDKQPDGRIQPFDVWLAATNQAQAEFDALAADAARYRWLKERATVSHVLRATPTGFHYPTTWHIVTGGSDTDIDAAIDAAMKEQ